MAYQEKITVENHKIHTDTQELVIYVPKDNSKIDFEENNAIKIEIYSLENKIYISKTNGITLNNRILDGYIEDFRITTKPDNYDENNKLEYVQIDFTVDYKIRGIKRDYSIKYNIRR
ncbi:hypothetical protein PL321_10530 [Caloramator sp. mosi_1]|uniref:hypothetical protein n=1 Tax=Caloramator sp. mosi_1 TaxID=3023090 RepID=UPI00236066C9|nr:hypothetical protein [Caloramator sp. mosi_1]WDC83226.1 hypothetical protein PL321_10530 [Caloramator sp. mosi_1]